MTPDDLTPDDLTRDDLEGLVEEWSTARVLGALAEGDASAPPDAGRDKVLRHAATTPRRAARALAPAAVYGARVVALRELLDELDPHDWQRTAAPYAWTVQGLVGHLTAIEHHTASLLGLREAPAGNPLDHLGLGAELIDAARHDPSAATYQQWSDSAELILRHVADPGFDLEQPLPLHGWPFRAGTALVARAFELWTHADDIRRATGRPLVAPSPEELRTMSSVSVRSLPAALRVVAPNTLLSPTRVVLTGPGGGTFDLPGDLHGKLTGDLPGDATVGERRNLLAVDVVDYCRVVARRLPPDRLDAEVEGDRSLVAALLEASRILAV